MDATSRILEENGVRLYYVRTRPDPGTPTTVLHHLVAAVVIDDPSQFSKDMTQAVIVVGRSPAPSYFSKGETPEDAYRRIEECPYDVYTPVKLYGREHAIDVLTQLKAVSAANSKWRAYYDQTDAIFDKVLDALMA